MFLVADNRNDRDLLIKSYFDAEPAISILLAAADFEWTVRRAILALGKSPTKHIRPVAATRGLELALK